MSGGGAGNTLREAYGAAANSAAELLELTHPGYDRQGMRGDGFGLIKDPRADHAERSPSFNTWRGEQDGAAMFQRKGSGETWNALQWLEQYGNGGAGMTRAEAAALLISRAGLERQDAEGRERYGEKSAGTARAAAAAPRLGVKLRERQAAEKYADDPRKVLKGWELLKRWNGDGVPAWEELKRRGLLPALESGLIEAYHLPPLGSGKGNGVRKIPRGVLPDALALLIRGPDGVPLAVKFRNPGTKAELSAAEVRRYTYPAGHKGTPAHCPCHSPN